MQTTPQAAERLGARLRRAPRQIAALGLMLLAACGDPAPQPPATAQPEDAAAAPAVTIASADGRAWRRLAADGLHDPGNDLIAYLQQPAEALGALPSGGTDGNQVDWMAALATGAIAPRTNILPETKVRVLDLDIVFTDTAGQPHVVFPHRQHTEWLDCSNCHPAVFAAKKGANQFGMLDILQGEYCGRCHGAVAFPLTECKRCHSRDWHGRSAN